MFAALYSISAAGISANNASRQPRANRQSFGKIITRTTYMDVKYGLILCMIVIFIMFIVCARMNRTPSADTSSFVSGVAVTLPNANSAANSSVLPTIANLPVNIGTVLFGKILAAYKQALAQYHRAWQNLQDLPAQQQQASALILAQVNAFTNTIDKSAGMTEEQQLQWDKLNAQLGAVAAMRDTQIAQTEEALQQAFVALQTAQQLLGAANTKRTPPANPLAQMPAASIQPQITIPYTKTQMPLYPNNCRILESPGSVNSRGYIAATCVGRQTTNGFQPFLFDTLLLAFGSTISIQNTPTSSTFILAPGYIYKCRAEILVPGMFGYNWYANGVQFGSIGMPMSKESATVSATGYIKNDTSEPMRVTIAKSIASANDGPAKIVGYTKLGIYIGPQIQIKEIATL